MSFIFKFKSNNGVYTLFDGAYSFIIATSKDTVIDCAKLTDQDLITLAQHVFIGEIITLKLIDFYAYVQLRLLGNLESPSNLQLQDEASIISNISKINFAGDAVVATLDPSDTSGKTGLITITSGGQNINKSIIEDPEIVYDNDYGDWVAKAELTGQTTDVTIVISSFYDGGNNGGEGGEYTGANALVIDMPVDEYAEGDIIRITLQLSAQFGEVVIRSVALLVPTVLIGSSDMIQRDMNTIWTYQKRD